MNNNPEYREQNKEMDQEYLSLMKELGEEVPQNEGGMPRAPGQTNPRRPPPMGRGYARPGYTPWGSPSHPPMISPLPLLSFLLFTLCFS